jgi:hypothetical protein
MRRRPGLIARVSASGSVQHRFVTLGEDFLKSDENLPIAGLSPDSDAAALGSIAETTGRFRT